MQKTNYVILKRNAHILSIIILCHICNISTGLMLIFYDKFGVDSLLIYRMLGLSNKINLKNKKFIDIVQFANKFNNDLNNNTVNIQLYSKEEQKYINFLYEKTKNLNNSEFIYYFDDSEVY